MARCSTEVAHHLLRRSYDMNDRVRRSPYRVGEWHVSSSTQPKVWYRVKMGVGCGCEGFRHRGICRHYVRVAWEMRQERETAGLAVAA